METLKDFRILILVHRIILYTDHNNLTFEKFTTERVLRWRLILEEYGPEIKYIKGPDNDVANTLIRVLLINSRLTESDVTR